MPPAIPARAAGLCRIFAARYCGRIPVELPEQGA